MDSNILIAYFATDAAEKEKKEQVKKALSAFSEIADLQLCTSMWAVTEMVNILVSGKRMARGAVAEIENHLVNEKRLEGVKIAVCEVSQRRDYDFAEFFFHVRQGILSYHSGVGDIIHSVIMKNNEISQILTFDEKSDFKQIPGLTVIHPKDVKI